MPAHTTATCGYTLCGACRKGCTQLCRRVCNSSRPSWRSVGLRGERASWPPSRLSWSAPHAPGSAWSATEKSRPIRGSISWPSNDAEPAPEHLYPLGETTRLVDQILAWWTELTTPLTDPDNPYQDRSAPRRADTQPSEQMATRTDSCAHPSMFLNPAHVDIGAS